ncbi:methyltransferase domain-containing protein [Gammaproteobacteria bacterium]|nr:methyltransferase domain-containing protein [Gammaproteobacteria bacterium]
MEDKNIKQKQFWSGAGGDVWVDKQREMDIMLNPLGERAIQGLDLSGEKKILDIGCGCGATTLEIAQAVTQGEVIGVDISEPMLERATKTASDMMLNNTSFQVKDVQVDEMPLSYFDIAFSRFGVMFFEDPFEAFKNINHSLKDNGQLSFVCWQHASLNPWQSLSIQVIKEFLDLPAPAPKSPGPFAFEDKSYINEILTESGFRDIEIKDNQEDIVMFSGKSIREACEDYLTINPVVTEMLKNSPTELREEILEALIGKFSDFHNNEGLLFPSATWIVTAKK